MKFNELIKPLLALCTILLSFAYFFTLLIMDRKSDPQILIAIVSLVGVPLAYYFGSSSGTSKKDDQITKMIDKQTSNQ